MDNNPEKPQGEERIGRLIAAAGPGPTASAEARARIYAAVRSQWQDSVQRQRTIASKTVWRRNRLLGMAASIFAAAALLYWLLPAESPPGVAMELARVTRIEGDAQLIREGARGALAGSGSGTMGSDGTLAAVVRGDVLLTGADGGLALAIGSGLQLRADMETELAFTDAGTIELRAGTLYVDSGDSGPGQPLEIRTPLGSVTHTGTQYEVQLGDSALRLRVREGSVQFSDPDGEATVGTAGEQVEIGADGSTARTAIAADDAGWDWAEGLATLPRRDAYRVGEVLRWLARERGLALEIAGDALAARLESAVESTGDALVGLTPAEAREVLERTNGLRISEEDGRLRVTD